MSTQQVAVPEFVQTYPGVSGTKMVGAVAGLAGGWYLHMTMIPDIGKDKVCQYFEQAIEQAINQAIKHSSNQAI